MVQSENWNSAAWTFQMFSLANSLKLSGMFKIIEVYSQVTAIAKSHEIFGSF